MYIHIYFTIGGAVPLRNSNIKNVESSTVAVDSISVQSFTQWNSISFFCFTVVLKKSFDYGVLGFADNPALKPGFFYQDTTAYGLGVLTKALTLGWVDN